MMSAEIWLRSRTLPETAGTASPVRIRDENGKREILSTSGGEYVIVDCCNDPQKLKAIQRRIQAQMNGWMCLPGRCMGAFTF